MTTTPSLHITYVEELHNLTQNGQIQPRLCGQISSQLWPAGPFPGGQMGSWLDIISHCNWAEPRNNGDTVQDTANTCCPSHLSTNLTDCQNIKKTWDSEITGGPRAGLFLVTGRRQLSGHRVTKWDSNKWCQVAGVQPVSPDQTGGRNELIRAAVMFVYSRCGCLVPARLGLHNINQYPSQNWYQNIGDNPASCCICCNEK